MVLTVAFDYGTRAELIDAVAATPRGGHADHARRRSPTHLYLPELPPVDVLVRTSGERRVSNFLLWQSAGAPIYFTDKTWPDFDAARARRRARARQSTLSTSRRSAGRRRRWRRSPPRSPAREDRPGQQRDGRGASPPRSTPVATSSCRPAPAPARRSPTSCRRCASGKRVVVATATKALQDQLASKDLPFLAESLPEPFDWAVLKGRSNYLCLQRLREVARRRRPGPARARGHGRRRPRRDRAASPTGRPISDTGDLAELDFAPVRRGVARGQRRQRRVPRRRPLPDGRAVLRRAGPPARRGRRRHRRQHAPLRAARRQRRRDPPRARRRGVRRGARARGHHERHRRRADRPRALRHARRGRSAASSTTDASSPAWSTSPTELREALAAHAGQRLPVPYPDEIHEVLARRPQPPRARQCGDRRHRHRRRGRQAAQAAGPGADRPGDRGPRCRPRHRSGATGTSSSSSSGTREQPAPRDRAARRRPGAARRGVGRAHGGPHQRHRAVVARRTGRPAAGDLRPPRRRQPVRLPAPRPALLRDGAARPTLGRLSSGASTTSSSR